MSDIAIKFENISKQYRLGNIGTGTLSHDLNRWWIMNIRGKEDPNLKIGQVNERATKSIGDYVWALNDINFEVKKGEVLGIIGKNGAGKSTLLKILSRVTSPTTGRIMAHGRIASLLEVGTGFHSEMTGRENIYMNGSIMGMTKAEITRKLDEIIDFAGVEKYIDTPVKRYSSGMTVRLGFAVAAHLEPEILVVDEVLAVGDADFQKKAIGKMQEISHGLGRTILFVSHNLNAINNLCSTAILLTNGGISLTGNCNDVIQNYLENNNYIYQKSFPNNHEKLIKIRKITLLDTNKNIIRKEISTDEKFLIKIEYDVNSRLSGVHFTLRINIGESETIVSICDSDLNPNILFQEKQIGSYASIIEFPNNILGENTYSITCSVGIPFQTNIDVEFYALNFKIFERRSSELIHFKRPGFLSIKLPWEIL